MMTALAEHLWDVGVTVVLGLIVTGLLQAWPRKRKGAGCVPPDFGEKNVISKKALFSQTAAVKRGFDSEVRSRAKWDIALALAGLSYVALALCLNLDSPVLVMAFVLLAAFEVIEPHLRKHGC